MNPSSNDIDISTQEGLDLLKQKAKFYGHYAQNLKVLELIEEIEKLRKHDCEEYAEEIAELLRHQRNNKLGW